MSIPFSPPLYGGFSTNPPAITQIPPSSSSSPSSSTSTSIIIVIIIIASAVIITTSMYLILRFFSKRFHRFFCTFFAADDVVLHSDASAGSNQQQCHVPFNGILDSLPLFTFGSVTGILTGGDCVVCLSRFESDDQLRLLPLCCHAFHADCIDAWIVSNPGSAL